MICVTGAGGALSSEVVRQVEGQAIPFRAAYFSEICGDRPRPWNRSRHDRLQPPGDASRGVSGL